MAKTRKKPRSMRGDDFFESAGVSTHAADFKAGAAIFAQGDACLTVMFIKRGAVKLSVVSRAGKEAVVGLLKSGDFLGEGCLAGQSRRMATATALVPTKILILDKHEMMERLHDNVQFSDRFLSHMLSRNIRIEEDLVDQLFNSSEKRLARALLLLARYGERSTPPQRVLPKLSQELLAEMIGTTRSRVNFFMNKFRKLGFIDYNGGLKIDNSLLSVILHD
jgi:CRP/FNR family transcriptional regulator, cyclic AMP receptor protein